jgi:gas vesicle protein
MTGSKWTGFFAFVLGASLGMVAGMLLAPKSGEELREDLSDRLNEGAHRVRKAGKSAARRAQDVAHQVQQGVSDVADAGVRAARKLTRS